MTDTQNNGITNEFTGIVGGHFGLGVLGFSLEGRNPLGDILDGDYTPEYRISVSFVGAKARFPFGDDPTALDLGVGVTLGEVELEFPRFDGRLWA
ncbi:MAG: hypothetical protein JKY00_04095 [Roseicyclus sp.]|nr:hypothetical protein [Roseicyclus sp.]